MKYNIFLSKTLGANCIILIPEDSEPSDTLDHNYPDLHGPIDKWESPKPRIAVDWGDIERQIEEKGFSVVCGKVEVHVTSI